MEHGRVLDRRLLTLRFKESRLKGRACNGASSEHDVLQFLGLYHMGGLGLGNVGRKYGV